MSQNQLYGDLWPNNWCFETKESVGKPSPPHFWVDLCINCFCPHLSFFKISMYISTRLTKIYFVVVSFNDKQKVLRNFWYWSNRQRNLKKGNYFWPINRFCSISDSIVNHLYFCNNIDELQELLKFYNSFDNFRNNLSFTLLFIIILSNDLIYSTALPISLFSVPFLNYTLHWRSEMMIHKLINQLILWLTSWFYLEVNRFKLNCLKNCDHTSAIPRLKLATLNYENSTI
jgi:hypothetical protein